MSWGMSREELIKTDGKKAKLNFFCLSAKKDENVQKNLR